jgi:hypothetical protein
MVKCSKRMLFLIKKHKLVREALDMLQHDLVDYILNSEPKNRLM